MPSASFTFDVWIEQNDRSWLCSRIAGSESALLVQLRESQATLMPKRYMRRAHIEKIFSESSVQKIVAWTQPMTRFNPDLNLIISVLPQKKTEVQLSPLRTVNTSRQQKGSFNNVLPSQYLPRKAWVTFVMKEAIEDRSHYFQWVLCKRVFKTEVNWLTVQLHYRSHIPTTHHTQPYLTYSMWTILKRRFRYKRSKRRWKCFEFLQGKLKLMFDTT